MWPKMFDWHKFTWRCPHRRFSLFSKIFYFAFMDSCSLFVLLFFIINFFSNKAQVSPHIQKNPTKLLPYKHVFTRGTAFWSIVFFKKKIINIFPIIPCFNIRPLLQMWPEVFSWQQFTWRCQRRRFSFFSQIFCWSFKKNKKQTTTNFRKFLIILP